MSADIIGLVTLSVTLGMHLIATVWWAASLTRRVDHIEKWIDHNGTTAERLAAMEQRIAAISTALSRIEHHLRQKP
jgi:hypothetical protein